jgi:hypothetical protein
MGTGSSVFIHIASIKSPSPSPSHIIICTVSRNPHYTIIVVALVAIAVLNENRSFIFSLKKSELYRYSKSSSTDILYLSWIPRYEP